MTSTARRTTGAGVLAVSVAGILWGTAPIAFDHVHSQTPLTAVAISAHRLAIAALALLVVVAARRRLARIWAAFRGRPVAISLVGLGVAAYQALWFASITYVGASIATVISLGLAPVLVTVWESARARRRPTALQVGVVVAALSGLGLVALPGSDPGTATGIGVGLAICSGTIYAATTILTRHVAQHVGPLALTTTSIGVGALALMPVAALVGPVLTSDPSAVMALLYLGVVTMALGYLALNSGLRTAPASAAAVATLLEPAVATLLAVTLMGERLGLTAGIGIALILSAVAALGITRRAPVGHPPQHSR